VSDADCSSSVQYSRTLEEYDKFDREMSVISAVWKNCKRLIEAYNEQQVSAAHIAFPANSV